MHTIDEVAGRLTSQMCLRNDWTRQLEVNIEIDAEVHTMSGEYEVVQKTLIEMGCWVPLKRD